MALVISPAIIPLAEANFPLPATGLWESPVVINDYVYLLFNGISIRAFNVDTGVEDPTKTISVSGLDGFPLGLVYFDRLIFVMTDTDNVFAFTVSGDRITSRDFTLEADDNTRLFNSDTHFYSLIEVSGTPTEFKAYGPNGNRTPIFDLTYPTESYQITTTMIDDLLVYVNELAPSTTNYTVDVLDVNTSTGYRTFTFPSESANGKAGFIFVHEAEMMMLDNSAVPNVIYDYTVPEQIDAVTELRATSASPTTVDLDWVEPFYFPPGIFSGYQVNNTTPLGNPLNCLGGGNDACEGTGSPSTQATATLLNVGVEYSFRVSVISITGQTNATGVITNATTLSNITPGNLVVDATNTNKVDFIWAKDANKSEKELNPNITTIDLNYNREMDLVCYFDTKLNRAKVDLPVNPVVDNTDLSRYQIQYKFQNATNDIITIHCTDTTLNSNRESKYLIPQTTFLITEQIQQFRQGQFGTDGSFGMLDLVSLVVVILAMIGFNRVNEGVGLIMSIVIIGITSFLGIFTITSFIIPIIAVFLMLGIAQMRK